MSQIRMLMRTVVILHTLPMTVKLVADTAARQRKAKYDIATPAAHDTLSAQICEKGRGGRSSSAGLRAGEMGRARA